MITIYGMTDSGNCYKPRLLLALLGIAFRHVEVDIAGGATGSARYLSLNANGKVPLLELDDGRRLAESNAILLYLAEGTRYLPQDRFARALVHQWLFFEQYSHEPNVAVRRSLIRRGGTDATPARLQALLEAGIKAFAVMERQLERSQFIAGDVPTVADIALYAYSHDAEAHGFDLTPFAGVRAWLDMLASDPRHVPQSWLPEQCETFGSWR
jgi:glutathione S-transferase